MPIFCETVSYKKICKESYTLGDLKANEDLIAAKDGTSSMVGSAGKSIRVLIGSSSISVGREEIFSCGDTNSTFGRLWLSNCHAF